MQQPIPESLDQAKAELDQVDAWLAQFEQMQTNHDQIEKRQAFLQGLLADRPIVAVGDPASNGSGHVDVESAVDVD